MFAYAVGEAGRAAVAAWAGGGGARGAGWVAGEVVAGFAVGVVAEGGDLWEEEKEEEEGGCDCGDGAGWSLRAHCFSWLARE